MRGDILMKRFLILLILISLLSVSSASAASSISGETLDSLQSKGLMIIESQSFPVELENWGKVRFVSGIMGDPKLKAYFFLISDKGEVLYTFPDFFGNRWNNCRGIVAVSFTDVNHDGLTDVVVIAQYATGVGPTGNRPYPIASVYFQKGKEFVNDPKLDEQLNNFDKRWNIDMVLEFMDGKTPQLD